MNHPQLASVNVGELRTVEYRGDTFQTGIFKHPVHGPVHVSPLGLEGDHQGSPEHHGGIHMAVYAYTVANYDHWRRELGLSAADLPHAKLGENLTIDGLDESEVCIGDRFRVGAGVELEVSVPRAPCSTLAMVMQDAEFPKRFLASGRVGFYLRVVETGTIRHGDRVERTRLDPARLTIAETVRLMYSEHRDREAMARAASVAALSPKWRDRFSKRLLES